MSYDVVRVSSDNLTLGESWNHFVKQQASSEIYHRFEWLRFFNTVYKHRCHYLAAIRDSSEIHAILPLVNLNSRLFGNFIVSVPGFSYCGLLSNDKAASAALLKHADSLRRECGASHVELRQYASEDLGIPSRGDKVSMRLSLPDSADELFESFPSKLRSQIRRPGKDGATAESGGVELLDDFYRVFSRNMRDLGTPVYPKLFFRRIFEIFPNRTRFFVVRLKGKTAAAGYTIGYRNRLEIPSASSLREFSRSSPNMLLYWTVLQYAIERGYKLFDFGRTTAGSGPHKFKKQWGAAPVNLGWYYLMSDGAPIPGISPENSKYDLAIRLWQRLPVPVANLIGPRLVRNLP